MQVVEFPSRVWPLEGRESQTFMCLKLENYCKVSLESYFEGKECKDNIPVAISSGRMLKYNTDLFYSKYTYPQMVLQSGASLCYFLEYFSSLCSRHCIKED